MAVTWVEGQANSKQAVAVQAFAVEEKVKIEAELQRRPLPSDLRRREAEAQTAEIEAQRERRALEADLRRRHAEAAKAEADARIACLQEQQIRLQLEQGVLEFVKRQKAADFVVLNVGFNTFAIEKVPIDFDWSRYTSQLLEAAISAVD